MSIQISNPKQIRVKVGDTLRIIAARELHDVTKWAQLAELNNLRPPYIIDSVNPNDRIKYTLIYGDWLKLPISTTIENKRVYAEELFGSDIQLNKDGDFNIINGDLTTLTGISNLDQALRLRLKTEVGELIAHLTYGCNISTILGLKNTIVSQLMGIGFVRLALRQETRINKILRMSANVTGDVLEIKATLIPVSYNTSIDLNLVYPITRS